MADYAIYIEHDDTYQDFADLVLPGHKKYCDKHNYDLIINKKNPIKPFVWTNDIKSILPNYKWVWMLGIDTMIMNHTIKIEDKVDNDYSMVVAADRNGPNLHSWLFKNDEKAVSFLNLVFEKRNDSFYKNHNWTCNKVLHDFYNKPPYNSFFKIVSGRYMNAYDQTFYNFHLNQKGADSAFKEGDWLLHMAGKTKDERFKIVERREKDIIY